jgi:hypothetical protein
VDVDVDVVVVVVLVLVLVLDLDLDLDFDLVLDLDLDDLAPRSHRSHPSRKRAVPWCPCDVADGGLVLGWATTGRAGEGVRVGSAAWAASAAPTRRLHHGWTTANGRNPRESLTRSCSVDVSSRGPCAGRAARFARLPRARAAEALEGCARGEGDLAPGPSCARSRRAREAVRRYVHDDRPRRDLPPRRPPPARAPRAREISRRPRSLRSRAQVGRPGVPLALLLPHPRARAAEGARLLPHDRRGARPEVPGDRRAAPRRAPPPHEPRRALQGHHPGEPGRGPAAVLPHLQARGAGGPGGAPAGGGAPDADGRDLRSRSRSRARARRGGRAGGVHARCGSSGRTSSVPARRP